MSKLYVPMKREFLLLLLLTLTNVVFSQYAKIPTDRNYYWRQWSSCNYHYQIQYEKDSLINGKLYNKYTPIRTTEKGTPCKASYIKHGFLRQDVANRMVFILDDQFREHPLYNFNKNAGDTFQVYQRETGATVTLKVVRVWESNNGGVKTKTLHVNDQNGDDVFTEGFGALWGGLFAHHRDLTSSEWEELVCYGTVQPYKELQVGTSDFLHCSLLTAVPDELLDDYSIKVYPIPFANSLTIELNFLAKENPEASLTNSLGQIIYPIKINAGVETVDLRFLPTGVYYLKVNTTQLTKVFKVIKN